MPSCMLRARRCYLRQSPGNEGRDQSTVVMELRRLVGIAAATTTTAFARGVSPAGDPPRVDRLGRAANVHHVDTRGAGITRHVDDYRFVGILDEDGDFVVNIASLHVTQTLR